jgi:hypothetical protein
MLIDANCNITTNAFDLSNQLNTEMLPAGPPTPLTD